MPFGLGSLFKGKNGAAAQPSRQEYTQMQEQTGFTVVYDEVQNGIAVSALSADGNIEVTLPSTATGEAHILYMEACELIHTRVGLGLDRTAIRALVEKLFAQFRRS